MYGFYLGAFLKELRERNGLTREELAGDFCDVTTLYRIEKGEQLPGRRLVNQLFSILTNEKYPIEDDSDLTEGDKNRPYLIHKIQETIFNGSYDYKPLLTEYISYGLMDATEEQTYLYYLALMKKHSGESLDEVFDILAKAASLTIKSRTKDFLPTRNLLTGFEARVVREIAMIHYARGKKDIALEIMRYFDRYYTRGICEKDLMVDEMPKIYHYLSLWELEAGNAQRSAIAAEKGVAASAFCNVLTPFPHLYKTLFTSLSIIHDTKKEAFHRKLGNTFLKYIPLSNVE